MLPIHDHSSALCIAAFTFIAISSKFANQAPSVCCHHSWLSGQSPLAATAAKANVSQASRTAPDCYTSISANGCAFACTQSKLLLMMQAFSKPASSSRLSPVVSMSVSACQSDAGSNATIACHVQRFSRDVCNAYNDA